MTTIETTNGHVADDDVAINDDDAVDDADEASADSELDLRDDEPVSGYGVDEVRDDVVVDEIATDEPVVDDAAVDEVVVNHAAVDDAAVDEVATDEPAVDEIAADLDDGSIDVDDVFVDDTAVDEPAVDDVVLDDAAESDEFGATGGSFYDLEADDVDVIGSDSIDLIDLEASHARGSEVFDEPMDLADPDSVFAESETHDGDLSSHAVTESVALLDPSVADDDLVDESVGAVAATTAVSSQLHEPKRKRRIRARKSRRVIRHIDPWSVLTFSVLFHMVVFAALLLSSVLVWNAAIASGMVENIESFIQELGDYETFEIHADVMFRAAVVIAGMLTLASSVMVVLLTVVFNLISDLVGGIRVTVIEEETVRVPIDKKRSKVSTE